MPVTNEVIDIMIAKLGVQYKTVATAMSTIDECMQTLFSIKQANEDTMPLDKATGEPMDEKRREAIFESVGKRAGKFLGDNK